MDDLQEKARAVCGCRCCEAGDGDVPAWGMAVSMTAGTLRSFVRRAEAAEAELAALREDCIERVESRDRWHARFMALRERVAGLLTSTLVDMNAAPEYTPERKERAEFAEDLQALLDTPKAPEHHPDVCPRGEHHRPGVVCGECGLLCPVAEPATTCKFPHGPERVCADCVCKGCMSVPCSCEPGAGRANGLDHGGTAQ